MIFLVVQPSESAIDQSGQFISSPVNGLVYGRCLMCYRDGLAAFEAGFYHATHIVIAALLVTVLIAQMNINVSDAIAESAQALCHYTTNLSG
ncbi:MAG: hypothetical protein V7L28_03270 [Nostoc sp.]